MMLLIMMMVVVVKFLKLALLSVHASLASVACACTGVLVQLGRAW